MQLEPSSSRSYHLDEGKDKGRHYSFPFGMRHPLYFYVLHIYRGDNACLAYTIIFGEYGHVSVLSFADQFGNNLPAQE